MPSKHAPAGTPQGGQFVAESHAAMDATNKAGCSPEHMAKCLHAAHTDDHAEAARIHREMAAHHKSEQPKSVFSLGHEHAEKMHHEAAEARDAHGAIMGEMKKPGFARRLVEHVKRSVFECSELERRRQGNVEHCQTRVLM